MIRFREKRSAALVFAILLHLGVFLIFYINAYEYGVNKIAHRNETNADQIITTNISNNYPPVKTQAHIITLEPIKTPSNIDNNQDGYLGLSKKPIVKTNHNKPNKSLEADDNTPHLSTKSETISNQNLQEAIKLLDKKRITKVLTTISTDSKLEKINNGLDLLNIDLPTRSYRHQRDKDYDSMKAEVEETTEKLSITINEVKKRNQQKIDEVQHQQTNTYNSEITEFSTEILSKSIYN